MNPTFDTISDQQGRLVGDTTRMVVYAIHQKADDTGSATTNVHLSDASGDIIFNLTTPQDTSSIHEFPFGVVISGGLYADVAAEAEVFTLVYQKI